MRHPILKMMKEEESADKTSQTPVSTKETCNLGGYIDNKPYKSMIKAIEDVIYEIRPMMNVAQFTRS